MLETVFQDVKLWKRSKKEKKRINDWRNLNRRGRGGFFKTYDVSIWWRGVSCKEKRADVWQYVSPNRIVHSTSAEFFDYKNMSWRFITRKKQLEHRNFMLYGLKIDDKLVQANSQWIKIKRRS